MPWKYTDQYYTEYTRTTWNESAAAYLAFQGALEPFRRDLIALLAPRPAERILDLGTGPGEPALTIATTVGPHGHVTGVDLSERMIEIARSTAVSRRLANVDFLAMDGSSLRLRQGAFDAAICSFGFQIFTRPEKVAREAHRVLRSGGRIAASVWSSGEKVPLLHAVVGPMLEHAEPDEDGYLPSPYETGGPGELASFLEAAGFRAATERRVTHPTRYRSADEYLETILRGTPLGHSLSEETPDVQKEVLRKARRNLLPWTTDDGVVLPAEAVLVRAER